VRTTDDTAQQGQKITPNFPAGYEQLSITYRAIDEFRARLLGFLPVATGGGLLLLHGTGEGLAEDLFLPVGLFGLVVTLGLFAYEIYGIEKCTALITAGKALEVKLGLEKVGQFQSRPQREVNEPFAAAIIYPAVMAAWTYLAALNMGRLVSSILATVVFVIGCALTLRYNRVLRKRAEAAAS
jgi:hypothetical protein